MDAVFTTLLQRHPALATAEAAIRACAQAWVDTFTAGNKLLLCGNGGSASDADHIAGELLKSFAVPRPLDPVWRERLGDTLADKLQAGLPAIPLTSFAGFNSAWSNDCDSEYAFAQLVMALGREGDCLMGISTSGRSRNVLHAMEVARARGMQVIALTGADGGRMKDHADLCIRVPEDEVYKIQELHLPVYHTLCIAVERAMFGA